MCITYDVIYSAFLSKVSEFNLLRLDWDDREEVVSGYLHRAATYFKKNCKYKLDLNDVAQEIEAEFDEEDVDEIVEILSEGMVVQWLAPYVNKQENLENVLSTRDFSTYSPAELLNRVSALYKDAKGSFVGAIREYSYNHNDLTQLHT